MMHDMMGSMGWGMGLAGLIGIAFAATAMLALAGMGRHVGRLPDDPSLQPRLPQMRHRLWLCRRKAPPLQPWRPPTLFQRRRLPTPPRLPCRNRGQSTPQPWQTRWRMR